MSLKTRKRISLKGTKISYDVFADQVAPVEVFVDGIAITKLSPVDAHIAAITLVTKLREMSIRNQRDTAQSTSRTMSDKERDIMEEMTSHFDKGMGNIDEGFSSLTKLFKRNKR